MEEQRTRTRGRVLAGRILLAMLLLAAVAAALGANAWKRSLRVASVRAEGNEIISTDDIVRRAGIPVGTPLFDVDLFSVERRIREHLFVRDVDVARNVPDNITITVREREPVAAITGERLLYVDADGMVLPAIRSENIFDLPVVTGTIPVAELTPGAVVRSPGLRAALRAISVAARLGDEAYRRISEVHVRPDRQLVLFTSEYGVPVLVGRGNVGARIVKFEGFWKEIMSHRGAQDLQSVDLRFEDQVVVRWN